MKAHPGYAHINRIRDYDANTKCIVLDAHDCDWCEYEYTYVRDPATNVWSMPSHMAREFVDILRQLCMAVHYCNWMGVAHCDIKPQNVLCDQDYSKCEVTLYLSDFGMCTRLGERRRGRTKIFAPPEPSSSHTVKTLCIATSCRSVSILP